MGNLFVRNGFDDTPVYTFGSHLDIGENGGIYDGALGAGLTKNGSKKLQTLLKTMPDLSS